MLPVDAPMARILVLLFAGILLAGCSIVQPHPDVVGTLRTVRLAGGVTVSGPSRLILPSLASVAVAHADGRIDNQRLLAAQNGLASAFSIAPADAPWLINVWWPDSLYADPEATGTSAAPAPGSTGMWSRTMHRSGAALRKAGHVVVRTADREVLVIDVVDTAQQTLVTRLEVAVEPWLRGRDWDDPQALTHAFRAVGAALSGR